MRVAVVSRLPLHGDGKVPSNQAGSGRYLAATELLPADKPAITALRDEILGNEKEPAMMVAKLARWTAAQVKESEADSPSPIATLASRSGASLSHARLYASLARAAGIPTRVVAGLVYVEGKGFLYHSWAESNVGEWVAVDPTIGAVPADATHIRLNEGDAPEDLLPLARIVGRLTVKVLEVKY
jgi:transglutaminase-like putative cysteine protease